MGYINPETGDLLTLSQFPGTSGVSVFDAVVGGGGSIDSGLTNVSQLVGLQYSNGQLIATNGGLTLFHESGATMRTSGTWKYSSGANLRLSGIYFWSNGNSMKSGSTYRHPNNIVFRNSTNTGSIFYAANTTFYNGSTGELYYPASVALLSTAGVYSYETGAQLDNSNVISYPTGATMIDASGNVFNADGSPATTPFSEHDSFTNSEVTTTVSNGDFAMTIAANQTVSGSAAAYVTRVHLIYPVNGDYNQNGHVDAADYVVWRKNVGTTNVLPNDNGLGTPIGQPHYDLWRGNFGQYAPVAGAGTGSTAMGAGSLTEPPADPEAGYPAGAVGVALVAMLNGDSARQPPALPGVSSALGAANSPLAPLTVAQPVFVDSTTQFRQAQPDLQLLAARVESQPRPAVVDDFEFVTAGWTDDSATQADDPALTAVDDAFALLATGL